MRTWLKQVSRKPKLFLVWIGKKARGWAAFLWALFAGIGKFVLKYWADLLGWSVMLAGIGIVFAAMWGERERLQETWMMVHGVWNYTVGWSLIIQSKQSRDREASLDRDIKAQEHISRLVEITGIMMKSEVLLKRFSDAHTEDIGQLQTDLNTALAQLAVLMADKNGS